MQRSPSGLTSVASIFRRLHRVVIVVQCAVEIRALPTGHPQNDLAPGPDRRGSVTQTLATGNVGSSGDITCVQHRESDEEAVLWGGQSRIDAPTGLGKEFAVAASLKQSLSRFKPKCHSGRLRG